MKTFGCYYAHDEKGNKDGRIILVRRPYKKKTAQVVAILTNAERYALIGELFNPTDAYINGDPVKK